MSCIVRIPAMNSEFWRMLRNRETEKAQAGLQKQAISHMIDWKVTD